MCVLNIKRVLGLSRTASRLVNSALKTRVRKGQIFRRFPGNFWEKNSSVPGGSKEGRGCLRDITVKGANEGITDAGSKPRDRYGSIAYSNNPIAWSRRDDIYIHASFAFAYAGRAGWGYQGPGAQRSCRGTEEGED